MVIRWRQVITVLAGVLAVCAISHADMMPVSPQGATACWQSSPASALTNLQSVIPATTSADLSGVPDLDLLAFQFLPEPADDPGQIGKTKPAQILTERQNSLTLCLYALLGLGLCRSAPFIKKLQCGCMPDWYHTGGPFQIGHSLAISPDCLPSGPAFCFLQPDCEVEDVASQYFGGVVAAFLRKSQFTPTILASRGPPLCSC